MQPKRLRRDPPHDLKERSASVMNCDVMTGPAIPLNEAPKSYCGPAADPGDLLRQWNADPLLLVLVALAITLFVRLLRREAANGRRGLTLVALFAMLYISPFCAWGSSLFAVRVTHHLLIALVLAPLAAQLWRRQCQQVVGGLGGWTAAATAAMWAWHAPNLYAWAVSNSAGYWMMQASIFATATLFWDRIYRSPKPAAIAALLAAMIAMGLLGALITLSSLPLYAAHFSTTVPWGLTPMEDQQVGGLIMWAPASAVYLFVALALVRGLAGREARA